MSYAPIYSKLHELEERLLVVESTKASLAVPSASAPSSASAASAATSDFDCSALRKEIDDLLKVVSTLATKAELPDVSGFAAFATKAELPDVSGFATKAELPDVSGFATKEELPDVSGIAILAEKFDNLINVVSQLNTKINEANEKIAALESA